MSIACVAPKKKCKNEHTTLAFADLSYCEFQATFAHTTIFAGVGCAFALRRTLMFGIIIRLFAVFSTHNNAPFSNSVQCHFLLRCNGSE